MAWAIGLVGCIGALGIGWQWSQATENLREANRQNEIRKVYFSKSLNAIDKMLTRVGFETLAIAELLLLGYLLLAIPIGYSGAVHAANELLAG